MGHTDEFNQARTAPVSDHNAVTSIAALIHLESYNPVISALAESPQWMPLLRNGGSL
jgi:hypothetical protein